jgi:hypothetical protein
MTEATVSQAPYVTIYQPIGGWNCVLMTWEEEFGCHTPWQTGFNNTLGNGSKETAIGEGMAWAMAEEIEFRMP